MFMKKKAALSNKKNKRSINKYFFLAVALFGLSIFIAGVVLQAAYEQKKLESKFEATEEKIDSILNEVSQTIPSASLEKVHFCDRYNVKFDEGELYCVVGFSLSNPAGGVTAEETQKMRAVIEKGGFKPVKLLGDTQIYENESLLSCRLNTPHENVSSNLIQPSFECRSNSAKAFYPFQD